MNRTPQKKEEKKRRKKENKADNYFSFHLQHEASFLQVLDEWEFLIAPIIFTALAFFTRLYQIGKSDIVTWDEAHFGKFGSHYISRTYYFDVHPPLGKMLVGLSGYMAGYNGSFEFKSGEKYPDWVNYTFMRQFNAFFGAIIVPFAYLTAKELKFKRPAVWLVTLMVLCENSYTTISRVILPLNTPAQPVLLLQLY